MTQISAPQARIYGLDLARALAILGMFISHLMVPGVWLTGLTSGFASALFAVLAGVSLGLMSARPLAEGGVAVLQMRHGLVVRGLIIGFIGVVLTALPTSISIVLMTIALEIILLVPVLSWSTRALWILFGVLLLIGSPIAILSTQHFWLLSMFSASYPLSAWLTYGVAGLLIYRLLVAPAVLRRWIIAALVSFPLAVWAVWFRSPRSEAGIKEPDFSSMSTMFGGSSGFDPAQIFYSSLSFDAHSGGYGDVILSLIVALAVIAFSILFCHPRVLSAACYPVRVLGQMALTTYVLHVLIFAVFFSPAWTSGFDMGSSSGSSVEDSTVDSSFGLPWDDYQEMVAEADGWKDFYSQSFSSMDSSNSNFSDAWDAEPDADTALWRLLLMSAGISVFAMLWQRWPRWRGRGPLESFVRWGQRRATLVDAAASPASENEEKAKDS